MTPGELVFYQTACEEVRHRADSARAHWTISRAGCPWRGTTGGAAHGGRAHGICVEPRHGVQAVEPERFAGTAPHDNQRARICIHGVRSSEGQIRDIGTEGSAAEGETGACGPPKPCAGCAVNEVRGA